MKSCLTEKKELLEGTRAFLRLRATAECSAGRKGALKQGMLRIWKILKISFDILFTYGTLVIPPAGDDTRDGRPSHSLSRPKASRRCSSSVLKN
jgi:hypothetical protein